VANWSRCVGLALLGSILFFGSVPWADAAPANAQDVAKINPNDFDPPLTAAELRDLAELRAAAANTPTAANPCPPVGADSACGVVLTIQDIGTGRGTCSPKNCISISNNQGPYDGVDDTLIGVVNSSETLPLASLTLTSTTGIFAFDGDGICGVDPNTGNPFVPAPPGCPFGPSGYEGPGVSFSSPDGSNGTVTFNPPIPPGGAAYFSLENSLTAATACSSAINNAVTNPPMFDQPVVNSSTGLIDFTRINASFTSNTNLSLTLSQAAALCGFTGWDWQQTITSQPLPSPFFDAADVKKQNPLHAPPSFNDPPPDDYLGANPPSPAPIPLYYSPFSGSGDKFSVINHEPDGPDGFILTFRDAPSDNCLGGGTGGGCGGKTAPNTFEGTHIAFTTHLVGLVGAGPGFGIQDTGIGFSWISTRNGTSGGLSVTRSEGPPDPGGTGGITVTMNNGVSSYQFPKNFGVSQINGNPVSSGSPAPPLLLGGGQILVTSSGLAFSRVTLTFNGTVTITNTGSSAIDGPLQIVFDSLTPGVTVANATSSFGGWSYITVPAVGSLAPGASVSTNVQFNSSSDSAINANPVIYSGGFN
jgi:hypothetical protein